MTDTLILNANGLPLSVVPLSSDPWQSAIKKMFSDEVTILAEYPNWEVHSPSMTIAVPSVMILKTYVKASRGVRFNRTNVLLRDNFICQYCGIDCKTQPRALSLDHVIPRFHGGKTSFTNIVASCFSCNTEKAHYLKMKPKTAPVRPTYYSLVQKRMTMPVTVPDESWIQYLGWDESLVTILPGRRQTFNTTNSESESDIDAGIDELEDVI